MEFLQDIRLWQWCLILGSSLLFLFISPKVETVSEFFKASKDVTHRSPGLWLLTSSLVVSWIFAKSITNAANLGLSYGIVGGVAYAIYYLSFLVAGIIIYQLRVKGGYGSIHDFLFAKFGKSALVIFSILIGFRLFNEVWSNTMVIGSYFGEVGTTGYHTSIVVFTLLTLAYALKGGLSSSMLTDAVQMIFFGGLLFFILGIILPAADHPAVWLSSGEWSLSGGLDLAFVALLQVFSYPFHDPVMTDRGFITDPKTMIRAFFIAVPLGFLAIVLFSLIGVYAASIGITGQAAVQVGQTMGTVMMLALNFIMITSASSTLDSAFSSFAKLAIVDLKIGQLTMSNGRLSMILLTIIGTIPVFFDPQILSATTLSGTMVIGLAPVFLCWQCKVPRYTFMFTTFTGMLFGLLLSTGNYPDQWVFFDTGYGTLLSANITGSLACFFIFFSCKLVGKWII